MKDDVAIMVPYSNILQYLREERRRRIENGESDLRISRGRIITNSLANKSGKPKGNRKFKYKLYEPPAHLISQTTEVGQYTLEEDGVSMDGTFVGGWNPPSKVD